MIKRVFIDLGSHRGMLKNRFNFRGEDEATVLLVKIERLYADAIAHQHQLFLPRIPECNRVVTFEVMNKVQTAFFVEMEDCFGVCAGRVAVPRCSNPCRSCAWL